MEGALGNGAVGLVRRAGRKSDGAKYALKILAPDPKYIEEQVFDDVQARFNREGERGAQLSHPNLLRIHALEPNAEGVAFEGRAVKNPVLLMELSNGWTLETFIHRVPENTRGRVTVDPPRLRIAIQMAEALHYLHARKLIHRDIKPANVFLSGKQYEDTRNIAKVGDFGIMKWGDFHASISTGTLTMTMQSGLGTMKYMSPEQAVRPKNVSARSDIFSFGITLLELFSGSIMASHHHVTEVMLARLQRGTAMSRFDQLGIRLNREDGELGELILDMHLRGADGRPPIDRVHGRLVYEWERRTGAEWVGVRR